MRANRHLFRISAFALVCGAAGWSGCGGKTAAIGEQGGSESDAPSSSSSSIAACLRKPGSCAVCSTQNPNDTARCLQYIQCFEQHDCDPHTACGAMDGVCGVNVIGGGSAPFDAAVMTFDCACH